MRRRELIGFFGGAAAWPCVAGAQQLPRLAWIEPGTAAAGDRFSEAFRAGLADNGLVEKRDYVLDLYPADGDYKRFPSITRQALATAPSVLLVSTIASVRAAQEATTTVPIVFVATNDPVGAGLIDSLARPGGNTTGVATMADDAVPKLVGLVRTALPNARRLAVLINPLNPTNRPIFEKVRAVGSTLGLEVGAIEIIARESIASGLAALGGAQPDAILVVSDALLTLLAGEIAQLGIERRIAVLGQTAVFAQAGALLSYGSSFSSLIRRSAFYVKRILAGAKPRDLPAEQPTAFELAINLRTATALGVSLPSSLLATADQVID